MKIKILIVMALVLLGMSFEVWDLVSPPPGTRITTEIKNVPPQDTNNLGKLPEFKFTSSETIEFTSHNFEGKTIILNFWATWCTPCIAEFPDLITLAADHPEKIVLLALSVDENPQSIDPFFKRFKPDIQSKLTNANNIIIGLDSEKKISQDIFGTVMYPETFIIAPDLTIRKKVAGVTDWTGDDIKMLIKQLNKP